MKLVRTSLNVDFLFTEIVSLLTSRNILTCRSKKNCYANILCSYILQTFSIAHEN